VRLRGGSIRCDYANLQRELIDSRRASSTRRTAVSVCPAFPACTHELSNSMNVRSDTLCRTHAVAPHSAQMVIAPLCLTRRIRSDQYLPTICWPLYTGCRGIERETEWRQRSQGDFASAVVDYRIPATAQADTLSNAVRDEIEERSYYTMYMSGISNTSIRPVGISRLISIRFAYIFLC